MPREKFDQLREEGWTYKPAGLYQTGGANAHPMVRVVQLAQGMKAPYVFTPPIKVLGDLPGHEFHGNQWTSGGSSGFPESDTIRREHMAGEASERADEKGDNFIERLQDNANEGGRTGQDSEEMLAGLERYQRDGYRDMNSRLWSDPEAIDNFDSEDADPLLTDVEVLSRMLDEAPALKESVIAYRGVQLTPELERSMQAGAEVTLNGFQSSSFDPGVAYSFATGQGYEESPRTTIFEIRANQGLSLGSNSLVGETEFIMQHGLSYVVRSVGEGRIATRLGPKKVRLIQLEMKSAVGKR